MKGFIVKCPTSLMLVFLFLLIFWATLLPSPYAIADSDFNYCWVQSSSDEASEYHSLRSIIENNFNKDSFCRSTVFFEKNKSFYIKLQKSLTLRNTSAQDYDDSGMVFALTGHQSGGVVLDGSELEGDDCVLNIDVNTQEGPVLIADLTLRVKKVAKAICAANENVEVITHNLSIEAEDDPDEDKFGNESDNCPNIRNPEQSDSDQDGVGDACDNCPLNENPEQVDSDDNGLGDACETISEEPQLPPRVPPEPDDGGDNAGDDGGGSDDGSGMDDGGSDGAGVDDGGSNDGGDTAGDAGDAGVDDGTGDDGGSGGAPVDIPPPENPDDQDGDGVLNMDDNCPSLANEGQEDEDGDGIGDVCDPAPSVAADTNEDSDFFDVDSGAASSCSLRLQKSNSDWRSFGMVGSLLISSLGFLLISRRTERRL